MKTRVVNLRKEPFDVYIGRAGHGQDGYFGNPFRREDGDTPGSTLVRFKTYFLGRVEADPIFRERILALKGKTLGCFCTPKPCHGSIIARWIDEQTPKEDNSEDNILTMFEVTP